MVEGPSQMDWGDTQQSRAVSARGGRRPRLPRVSWVGRSASAAPVTGPGPTRPGSVGPSSHWCRWTIAATLALVSGCTFHPEGEQAERRAALAARQPTIVPPMPAEPTVNDLVRHALLTNAGIGQRYWAWRSAIEQVPQDGTQPFNVRFSPSVDVTRGDVSLARTTIGVGNGSAFNIIYPEKLAAAARRSLDRAQATGLRFVQAKLDLRAAVVRAYDDYALSAELQRLERSNARLLETITIVAEARVAAGAGGQRELLKARDELDLSRNVVATYDAQLPTQRAALNALLNRPADAPLPLPRSVPTTRPVGHTDAEVFAAVLAASPELAALSREQLAERHAIALARLQYYPNFALGAATDLAGVTQTVSGALILPLVRLEGIAAGVRQAEADLAAVEAARRQAGHDLDARAVMDLRTLHDADRQLELFDGAILPRARQVVDVARQSYEAGRVSLLDVLDDQRSLIAIERLVATLRATRDQRLADVESLAPEPDRPATLTVASN